MINWDNKAKGDAEQLHVLVPLSALRAEAIRAALVERGIAEGNLLTEGGRSQGSHRVPGQRFCQQVEEPAGGVLYPEIVPRGAASRIGAGRSSPGWGRKASFFPGLFLFPPWGLAGGGLADR